MSKAKKIITAAVITAVLICTALFSVSIKLNRDFEKLQTEASYSVCTAESKIKVKASPYPLGLPKESIPEKAFIKILASKNGWSKIVAFTDKKILSGYVKTDRLPDSTTETVTAASINFGTAAINIAVNEEKKLEPAVTPFYSNETIAYSSSNTEVAVVENGVIKGISEGSAEITAKVSKCTQTIKVNVVFAPTDFKFTSSAYYIDLGFGENLYHLIDGKDKETHKIIFKSDDENVIRIKGTTADSVNEGEATITAVMGNKTAKCRLIVRSIAGNDEKPLNTPNAYGNAYNFHPSMQFFETPWNGYSYWCAFTPYEGSNDMYETPHILASNDLEKWETPAGFKNPLEPEPADYEYGSSYNSDTELVYNSDTNELECWWRTYAKKSNQVLLYRKTTKDGVHWSDKQITMLSKDMTKHDFLSPALVYEDHKYKMWSIDYRRGCVVHYYESTDGLKWSKPKVIELEYEIPNLRNWHLDVIHTPRGYEMLISAFPNVNDNHLNMDLYYAFSKDNETYTKARTIMRPTRKTEKWDNKGLYRSSLMWANNKYYCIYSAVNAKKGPIGLGIVSGDDPFHMR